MVQVKAPKIVLGIDPGYKNLGICVVNVETREIIHSENFTVGGDSNIMGFSKKLWPKLEELYTEYGFEAIGTETPPFIMRQIKITTGLWAVSSIINAWATYRELEMKHIAPITIKKRAVAIMGGVWDPKNVPRKPYIRKVVEQLTGAHGTSNHDDDAILAALLLYGDV
jgi:Holliday junction resolvasome RuvABC endonuclease subunit